MTEIRVPIAPPADVAYAHKMGRGKLIPAQLDELVKAINPAYVEGKQGKSYIAQHQARAEMNRIFGYGNWDGEVLRMELMYEFQEQGTGQNASKMYWIAGYRCLYQVKVRDFWGMPIATYSEWHAEENAKLPNRGEAHAFAMTSVESYALRRSLINLGDRFGLGLYDGGKTDAHGQWTLQNWAGISHEIAPGGVPQPVQNPEYQAPAGGVASQHVDMVGGQERFVQGFQQVQDMNQQARERAVQQPQGGYPTPSPQGAPAGTTQQLLGRMQGQMKLDGQELPMQGDVNGTSAQYAQDNG